MVNANPVAVIDIGSNSIKLLVAQRAADGDIEALHWRTIDARIGAGISRAHPQLSAEGMATALEAIRALLAEAAPFQPSRTVLVATSAVRDAANGAEFRARVQAATGHEVHILTGDEEANTIGRGLASSRVLADLRDFYVFDLGGGSMECLAFRNREIEQAVSLQLGCVRLMEKFVGDPSAPLQANEAARIAAHTRDVVTQSGFEFSLPTTATAIGTGGTITTVRSILGARAGKEFADTSDVVTRAELRELLTTLGALPLAARREVPGLPAARADVFPTALVTFGALAELGGFSAFRNSLRNLRYGLADSLLS